jgi:16S rRNA (guanine966-N2)-methyltransferase
MPLRIISGEFRRRLLQTPHGQTTRPYTDRVRQMVFDRISELVPDARVADVFSGVGTMGLEALSRGSQSCVFIEGDAKVHEALSYNVRAIVTDRQTLCWKTNIHRTSFCPSGADGCLPYDLVFFDPPYDQCPLLLPGEVLYKALGRLAKPRATSENAVVILRTSEHFLFSGAPGWRIDDHWPISTMNLWILRKSGNESETTTEDSFTPLLIDSGDVHP